MRKMTITTVVIIFVAAITVAAQTTYSIAIADGLPDSIYRLLRPKVLQLYAESAAPGDNIQVIEAPSQNLLGSLKVPSGNARQRLMVRSQQEALARILNFLDHPAAAGAHRGNLYLPTLVPLLSRVSSPSHPVLLVGDVQFHPMWTNDSEWDTDVGDGGLVPHPDDLYFEPAVCPFGTASLPKLNGNVYWLVPRNDWAKSGWQQQRLTQFWSWYFARLNAGLEIDSSPERAIDDFLANRTLTVTELPATNTNGRLVLSMLAPPPPPPPQILHHNEVQSSEPASGGAITDFPPLPQATTGHTLVAAAWSGNNQTDLDIWFRLANGDPSDEINFTHMQSPAGHLLRDIRQATPDGLEGSWTTSCECAEIYTGNLENIVLFIDVYANPTSQPVTGTLRVVWRGQTHDIPFSFGAIPGDHSEQRGMRDQSSAWKRIDLSAAMFH
jgi:hypothetical protein